MNYLKQNFRHSYSKEFNRFVNSSNPESYVIDYSFMYQGKRIDYFSIEYRSRTNDFIIFSVRKITDPLIPNCIILKTTLNFD